MIYLKPYYNSIEELPMFNWLKLNSGEYKYLLKPFWLSMVERMKETPKRKARWFALYDQYINEIGLTEDYKELLRAMKKHGLACVRYIQNPTSLNATKMAAAESEIQDLSKGEKGKFEEFVAMVEKYMGIPVNLKKISVKRFYAYVEIMKKENGKKTV